MGLPKEGSSKPDIQQSAKRQNKNHIEKGSTQRLEEIT